MRHSVFVRVIVTVFGFVSMVDAQQPGGGRGGPPPGMNQRNLNIAVPQQGNLLGNEAAQNQNGNQGMPTIDQLAQMMIARFDADESGELSEAELQNALTALRQMMQNQAGDQDQTALQQNGLVNQQNVFQGRLNSQFNPAQVDRPPPPTQTGLRRGR